MCGFDSVCAVPKPSPTFFKPAFVISELSDDEDDFAGDPEDIEYLISNLTIVEITSKRKLGKNPRCIPILRSLCSLSFA